MSPLDNAWRTPSRSGNNGQCVEARLIHNHVEVRDSKDRNGPSIAVPPAAWATFATGLKAGLLNR